MANEMDKCRHCGLASKHHRVTSFALRCPGTGLKRFELDTSQTLTDYQRGLRDALEAVKELSLLEEVSRNLYEIAIGDAESAIQALIDGGGK